MPTPRLTVSAEERTRLAKARLGQRVLGKWRLDELLGVGGMAAVFEATHPNGNRVAIKILHADLTPFDDIRERFLAEGYAANRVAHPGAVTVRDEGTTEDGAVFLVMDLLRGQTLAQRLEPGGTPLSVGEVLDIASQLLDVLAQAHDRGIVHRDIKPENVFLTTDGRVKLLDFGIARMDSRKPTRDTELGSTLGTPAFMPPEQALGHWEDLDGRSDLWALGATMYLLLSGLPVRERGSITEQLLGAMTRPVPSLGEVTALPRSVTALPRSVVAVVDRALAFDREERFPDARSMQLAVQAVQLELRAPDSRATLPPPSVEPMALSLRAPRADAGKRPSISTVRPVASTLPPEPLTTKRSSPGALPVYAAFGFALGIGIVVAARFTGRPAEPTSATQPSHMTSGARPPASVSPTPGASVWAGGASARHGSGGSGSGSGGAGGLGTPSSLN